MTKPDLAAASARSRTRITANASSLPAHDDPVEAEAALARTRDPHLTIVTPTAAPATTPAPAATELPAPDDLPVPAAPQAPTEPSRPALRRDKAPGQREPLSRTLSRRGVEAVGDQTKIHIVMPVALFARLSAYEDRMQIDHGITIVRATLVGEALRRLPDDLSKVARFRPDPDEMLGPRHDLSSRVPRNDLQRIRSLRARHRHSDPGLTLNDIACTAVAALLSAAEAEHPPAS
jgi:hypothetical protein